MAEEENSLSRVMRLVVKCQWQTQELKLKRTKMPDVEKRDENGNVEEDKDGNPVMVDHSLSRTRLVRKCEFPNAEAADEVVKFLSSDDCLDYLKLCRKQLNETVGEGEDADLRWTPVQAWYSEEDATSGRARHGMLYHVLKAKGDDGDADGPYVTTDGCKYHEEYYFYWDVDEPPELPKSTSGVQWSMDIKRRDDSDGLGGLYDCTMVKRTTLQQDVEPYESHHELGETRVTAQMLGVSDESVYDKEGNRVDEETLLDIDEKIDKFAEEQGLQLEDGPAMTEKLDANGNPALDKDGKPVMVADYGVVVDISKEKNADCTTSVSIVNTKEEKNLRSTVIGEQTIRAKKLTVVDENVAPEDDEGGNTYPLTTWEDGKVVRKTVSKTKGGVRVIQTETTEAVPVEEDKGTTICEATLFEHQHTTVAEAQDNATPEATVVNKTDEGAQVKASGNTYRIQSTLRDDGKFDIQSTKIEELPVSNAVKHFTQTGISFTSDVTNKNQTAPTDADPSAATTNGTVVDTQVTRTPGGAYDVRTVTRTPKKVVKNITFAKNVTARRTTQLHIRLFENCNLTNADLGDNTFKADGSTFTTFTDGSIRLNEYGLYDGQLQYYEDASDDGGGDSAKEHWAVALRTNNGLRQFGNGWWSYVETWVEAAGYKEADLDEIYGKFTNAKDVQVSPANRERTEWSIRVESPHYFVYTNLTSGASFTNGTEQSVEDYQWTQTPSDPPTA